ncbi:MAG: VWA domain-containing protein [Oligosphaeraceae bacterium]
MILRWEHPWALLALLLPPLLWGFRALLRRTPPALPLPGAALRLPGLPLGWRLRLRWLPEACLALAWTALTVALARPQKGSYQLPQKSQGIAIEMVLDCSGSMGERMDFFLRSQNRLETVKDIFREFALGGDTLSLGGRPNDLMGIITFARYPYTVCPLTLDHQALAFALRNVQLTPRDSEENSTAIGDAVAMGVARLADAENTLAAQTRRAAEEYQLKSKVMILLTDGQDEGPHQYSIAEATELALAHGIRVYAIAIQDDTPSPFRGSYDTSEIQALATRTGGLFQRCRNAQGLAEIYRSIDALEQSQLEAMRFVATRDLQRPLLCLGLAALLVSLLLTLTLFSRRP